MNGRMWLTIVFCSVGLLNASADEKTEINSMTRYVLEHEGLEPEYFVFLPSSYDGPTGHPVAIFLQGYGGPATGPEAKVEKGLKFSTDK